MDSIIRIDPSIRTFADLGALVDPILIAGFAGAAGSTPAATVAHLAGVWAAGPVADIDPDSFYDFTVARPIVATVGGERVVDWPGVQFWHARPTGANRDVILLSGIEPHLRWQQFAAAVAEVAYTLGVTEAITLGAHAAAIPHTRRTPALLSGGSGAFVARAGQDAAVLPDQALANVGAALTRTLQQVAIPTAALDAMAPFYISIDPCPQAMAALIDAIDRGLGTESPTEIIDAQCAEVDAQAAYAMENSPEVARLVADLEQQSDGAADGAGADLHSDEVLAEAERLLRHAQG